MKISQDLRIALRAASTVQTNTADEFRKLTEKAIADLKKSTADGRELDRLEAEAEKFDSQASTAREAARNLRRKLGLATYRGNDIEDHKKFLAAGGKLAKGPTKPWVLDNVLAQLTRATPAEGAKILKDLGVNWE